MERMLPGARHDTASALVLGGLTLDEMCDALAYGLGETQEAQAGLSRAVQNLMRLGMHDRDDVLGAAASAMAGAGLSEGFGAAVLEEAHPSQLKIEKLRPAPEEAALTSVLKLIDIASTEHTIPIDTDTEITALRVEARRGITDGDVLGSLVTIAALEKRGEPFASIMSLLEDNAQLLIDRQEFDVAVWAAQALRRASAEEERDEAQRRRIGEVLGLLADKRSIRTITQAMRSYPSSSREHQACRSLIRTLGEHAINGLLEVLAEEPDMGARKSIVDVMADMATPHISKLGAYLGDNRWYFVRNIVSILASTRDPAVLPHLQRTLRYPDARVRRETIRAAAGIRDARAGQMLVAALADEDAQNVQIAARFLGSSRWRGGVTALHQVAQGEGKGNRETGPRVEAIEALGQIGAPESVPILKSISRAGLLSRGRSKELRAAADSALAAIKSISSKGGR
jgi:HEAT repeat protein